MNKTPTTEKKDMKTFNIQINVIHTGQIEAESLDEAVASIKDDLHYAAENDCNCAEIGKWSVHPE